MISIIVPTLNRNTKAIQCLTSLLSNTNKQIEIIVLDQNVKTSAALINFIHSHPSAIRYIKTNTRNKSIAMNSAISLASGEILAFTDDDCIVSNTWINEIKSSFVSHSGVSCITGNTHPYGNIPLWACPPNISTKNAVFSKPQYHPAIGFGNNFAIRQSVFTSIGLFKTWLGPGSVSTNCEDGEMILRILTKNRKIFHNQNMVVYHNKNLNSSSLKKQEQSYVCGEMACYGYYALSGYGFAARVVAKNLADSFGGIKRIAGDVLKRKILRADDWTLLIITFITRIKGLVIGLLYYLKEVSFRIGESEILMN